MNPIHSFVSVGALDLHFIEWRLSNTIGRSTTVFLLHGDMRTSRSWNAVARRLSDDFHVIALDSRGHGDSDWPDTGYTFAQRIDDLEAFADAVGMRDAVAVAHSTGGVVAAMLSVRRPDIFTRLVLLEPMIEVTEAFQRMVSKRAETPRRTWASREDMYDYLKWHRMTGKWPDEVIRDVVEHEAYERSDGRWDMKWATASMNWKEREGDYLDLRPTLRRLDKPVLFITSDSRQSGFLDVGEIAKQKPNFEMLTIKDSGHNMYMDRPDAVANAVKGFACNRE